MKHLKGIFSAAAVITVLTCGLVHEASAQDLVYKPTNPAFGGSPYNYSWMMNSANTQNKFKSTGSGFSRNPLDNFKQSLQRQVLSQLTRQIIGDRFGQGNINLDEQNTFEFGEFNISVNPGPDGVSIDIRNILSGESTSITIPSTGFGNTGQ